MRFTAVDLFAGGGGLTVGLRRAGFDVVAAVELDSRAYSTYKVNHAAVKAFKQDVREIDGSAIISVSPTQKVDLLAGCPPCQGFTSLTSKYRRHDPRNDLVFEMARLVREIRPNAVMMENVPGLADKGRGLFNQVVADLEQQGYMVNWDILQVADYGVPQRRRRLVLLAGLGFKIELPEPTHSYGGRNGKERWRTLAEAISHMAPPVTLSEAKKSGGPQAFNWHVVRDLSETNIERLRHAVPGASRSTIPDELRPECHRGDNKSFPNVYGRMEWDAPSVTITGGCTTLSKGRFGHPRDLRTISVREAAILQTFDPEYVFDTDFMDDACKIIGNALPCDFATIVSESCRRALELNMG